MSGEHNGTWNATESDFSEQIFFKHPLSIFRDMDRRATLECILPGAKILSFERKTKESDPDPIVFKQEDRADSKIRVILSGVFSIRHFILNQDHEICVDHPGIILSDVELLLHNVDAKLYRRGQTNHNLATVVCVKSGRILEFDPKPLLLRPDVLSTAFALNLGRQVALKLMRRNADSDDRFLKQEQKIGQYLARLLTVKYRDKLEEIYKIQVKTQPDSLIFSPMTDLNEIKHAHVARALHLLNDTPVHRFGKGLQQIDPNFVWHKGKMTLSRSIYEKLRIMTPEQAAVYLCSWLPSNKNPQSTGDAVSKGKAR